MKKFTLLSAITFLLLYSCAHNNYLNLDYRSFDQDPNSGWRRLAQEGKFTEAGNLIARYLKKHADLSPSQTINLNFHAGQMYAIANSYETVLRRFNNAKYDQDFEGIPEDEKAFLEVWNAYVDATEAYAANREKSRSR